MEVKYLGSYKINIMRRRGLDSSGSSLGPVAGFCERGHERSVLKNDGKFFTVSTAVLLRRNLFHGKN